MAQQKKKRTLEDLFAPPPPERENYVEDPNRENILSDRLDEEQKAKAVELLSEDDKDTGSGAINVSGIVPPKQEAPPAPVDDSPRKLIPKNLIPPEEMAATPPPPKEDPKREAASEAPKKESDSSFPWDRALVGATPLLVGLLTGNELEGAQVASDHVLRDEADLTKRKRDLDGRLAEMQAKSQSAAEETTGKRRFRAGNMATPDGRSVKYTFDSFTGKYLYPDGSEIPDKVIRSGYAVNPEEYDRRKFVSSAVKRSDAHALGTNITTDPTTGELAVKGHGRLTPVEGQHGGDFTVKGEKDINAGIKEFRSSPAYQDSTQALQLAPTVNSLLDAADRENDPNSIAGSSVVLTMIRQAQRVGVATDKDAASMGGTQQWAESIKRLENKLLGDGTPLTDRDIEDLREISSIYTKRAQDLLGQYKGEKVKSLSSRYGIAPELIEQQLGADVNPYLNTADSPIEGRNAPVKIEYGGEIIEAPDREYSLPVLIDGEVLFIKPENWGQAKDDGARRLDQ